MEKARESVNHVEMDSILKELGQPATPVERIKTHPERQRPPVLRIAVRLLFHYPFLSMWTKWPPSLFVTTRVCW